MISLILPFAPAETAHTLAKGEWEMGLFQPYRRGLGNGLEISSYPVYFFAMPNFQAKKEFQDFGICGKYGISYPTPLLRLMQKKGMFGFISPTEDVGEVPHLIGLSAELLATRTLGTSLISLKGGLSLGLVFGKLDDRMSIDLPNVYPRLAKYFQGVSFNIGGDSRVGLTDSMDLLADVDLFFIPEEDIFLEQKALVEWHMSQRLTTLAGAKLTYGNYPFGEQWRLYPLFDLVWRFH